MRPKNKKHKLFTHRQQKIPRTKPQKRKNKQQPLNCCFLSHSRPLYSSHTTHHPNKQHPPKMKPKKGTTKQILPIQRGDSIEQQPCVAPDTQQHAKQQNKPSKPEHKHTHPCFTDPPHTRNACGTCFHLQTKKLATTRY